MSKINLEEAKAFLQKDSGGTNLYDHLSEVLLKILVEKPENSCEAFENISEALKQARFKAGSNDSETQSQSDIEAKKSQENWCDAAIKLVQPMSEEEAAGPASGVADLLDEANMFEWAGIGFSRGETFRLAVSLQKLAAVNQTTTMRLWGKILGNGEDYYIAEGQSADTFEAENPSDEESGTSGGVNQSTYWAMKDDGEYSWVKLPSVSRAQIQSARQLHRFVGPDLDAKVPGNPPFPGTEKNFLRAQIARITSATVVCPAGYYSTSDEGELQQEEEIESKSAQDLADAGNWVHLTKEINSAYGRTNAMPPRENEDGEEIPWEGEEFVTPLRALSEDSENSWKVYTVPETNSNTNVGEVAVLKSLNWPGAAAVGLGKKFLNIYVGFGLKYRATSYQPPLPATLQTEYGVSVQEVSPEGDASNTPIFTNLTEQNDILEDPTPPEAEDE